MKYQDHERRWHRLSVLLDPIQERAQATARNLCRSSGDGDDLFQEAVLRAFDKLHTLRDETRFRSWFFAVLLSVHRSRSRRGFWKRFLPLDRTPANDREPIGEDGHAHEEEFLAARRVAHALSRLPAEQREAVVLHELEGFTMEEIAEMQGASVPAVKSRVLRGRERLRRHYRALGFDSPTAPPATEASPRIGTSSRRGSAALPELAPAYSSFSKTYARKGDRHE